MESTWTKSAKTSDLPLKMFDVRDTMIKKRKAGAGVKGKGQEDGSFFMILKTDKMCLVWNDLRNPT